jgi:DNA (cytosine-5)-methyltransferase 3A
MKPQVVLSLFDGMSCGQIALNRLGIPIKTYYASEIDPYPIKVTQANYPDTVQLGDVRDISLESLPEKPDIILAGSPCTGFSFAGKRLAFDDPQSVLFFEFVRLLKEIEPKWFLLENVKMKKEYLNVITEHVGVEPILLNSALVSAQNRWRYYWTNIPGINEPEDKGIVLRNILETNPDNFTLMSSKFVTRQKDRKCLIGNEQEKAKTFSAMECIKNGRQGDYIACDENGNTKQMDKYKDDLSRLPDKADVIKSNYYKSSQANFENDKTKGSKFSATGVPQKLHKPKQVGVAAEINGHDILKRVYSPDGKSPTLNSCSGGNREPKVAIYQKPRGTNKGGIRAKDGKTPSLTSSSWQENNLLVKAGAIRGRYNGDGTTYQKLEIKDDGKNNTLTTVEKDNVLVDSEMRWRKLTPIEAERLQTVDDNYTAHVSNSRRYHMLGNGWTIEIICHILKNMVIVEQGGEVEDRKGQIGFEF